MTAYVRIFCRFKTMIGPASLALVVLGGPDLGDEQFVDLAPVHVDDLESQIGRASCRERV